MNLIELAQEAIKSDETFREAIADHLSRRHPISDYSSYEWSIRKEQYTAGGSFTETLCVDGGEWVIEKTWHHTDCVAMQLYDGDEETVIGVVDPAKKIPHVEEEA